MPSTDGKPVITPRLPRAAILSFVLLVLMGCAYLLMVALPRARFEAIEQWRGRLAAMADDRRAAIGHWVASATGDATAASSFPAVVSIASGQASPTSESSGTHVNRILADMVRGGRFSGGWVTGATGAVLASANETAASDPEVLAELTRGALFGSPLADMRRSRSGQVFVYFAAPVLPADGGRPEGAVVFASDPELFLFPLLRSEPIPSASGETLIMRRDGADVVFLGPLRKRPDPPLTARVPYAREGLAAVPALAGRSEFGEFIDYMGGRIFAATRGVPGTSWGLVVKVDREEALAAYRGVVRERLAVTLALALGLAGLAYGFWRSRRAEFESRVAASRERLTLLLDHAHEPILFLGPDLRIVEANRRAEEFYGYSREELVGMHGIDDLRTPAERAAADSQVAEFERSGYGVFATTHLRRDGSVVPVEVSVHRLAFESGPDRIVVVRDVSERRAADERIQALVRILKMSNAIHELMARERDRKALFTGACDVATQIGGLRMAWVGLLDSSSARLRPVASAGAVEGYFDEVEVKYDDTPAGRGPAGRAVREGRTIAVEDVGNDPSFAPWSTAARARGYAACAVSPIRVEGTVIGVFGVYSARMNHFDAEMMGVLEELANDLGFALQSIEARDHLAESESRFRRLADNIPDVIYRRAVRPVSRYEYMSPAVLPMLGYTPDDFYADPGLVGRLMNPEDLARLQDVDGITGDPIVTSMRHRDGRIVLVEGRQQLVRDEAGEPVAVEGIARDVTEERRALEELRRTTATLAALIEASPLAIFTLDAGTTVGIWNPACERLLGWPAGEVVGRSLPIASPESSAEIEALRERVLDGGSFAGLELTGRRRKDGSLVDLSVSAAPIRGSDGSVATILCIAEDITARRLAQEELRKLSRAVEQSPVSIVITNVKGDIEYVNPKFTQVTGYSREDVLGRNPRILKSDQSPPELYQELWKTITGGREWRGELRNLKKNGETFWEEASISPVMDERGRITHFIAVKEDITARKNLQAQYEQAQKMEAVGQLAGGVAHDFNNLLTVISGYTSLLLRGTAKDSREGLALAEIDSASRRAAALTQQLLAFGRRQVLQPRPLNLGMVVTGLEKMLRTLIGEHVTLTTGTAPELGTVVADPGQMEQVILNLAVNARDAMPGGGSLEIRTENASVDALAARGYPGLKAGDYALLAIADTGEGIPRPVLPHIFEPFFTTKEKGKGTGLGLATVYGIVKQSGGGIYVQSELGKGTTFRIFLPRVAETAASLPRTAVETAVPRGAETILLVEDEDGVRHIVGRILEDLGYRVIPAGNAREASVRIEDPATGRVSLLLTDIVMPGMDGRTLSQELIRSHPDLRVLLMTGYTSDERVRSGTEEVGAALLQKPFRPEDLARKVREVLDAPAAVGPRPGR